MNTEFREGSKQESQESNEGGGEYEYTQHRPIWYGWSEMQRDLREIKELAETMGQKLARASP
jgi:hypothetical protein